MKNTNLFESFYNRIEELRIECGYSKKYVCEQIGIKEQTYQNWMKGHTNSYDDNRKPTAPTYESMVKLSLLYHKSIDYLMGYTDYTSIENEQISEITGLSDTAINHLRNDKLHTVEIINMILERSNYKKYPACSRLFEDIYTYMIYDNEGNSFKDLYSDTKHDVIMLRMKESGYLLNANNMSGSLLNDIQESIILAKKELKEG